jgi:hypothetical protein
VSIEQNLGRIATALEAIAQAMNPGFAVVVDGVEHAPATTLTKPPLAWFDAGNGCAVAVEDSTEDASPSRAAPGQTTWDWLGITPPAKRGRQKMPERTDQRGAERGNTRAGQCGRCGRAGRRRLNHKPFCVDCEFEPEWDE